MSAEALFPLKQNWEVTTLGDVAVRGGGSIQTGPFGSQLHASDYVDQGIPSIMPQNITTDRISAEGIARITEQDANRLSKYRVRKGDIVYSRRGDVERRALVRQENDGWLCGTGCLKVSFGYGVVVPEYAAFYLSHPASKAWVVQHAVGATMPNLNTSILSALPFVLPPIEIQEDIAAALSTLEDKIELNRQMNETLEEMARALFRDWFVDFGPTRRQMEGATDPAVIMGQAFPPEKATPLAPLFPAMLGQNDLPSGWDEQPFEAFVEIIGGGTPKTKNADYWCGEIPWFSVVDAPSNGGVYVLSTEKNITQAGLDNSSARLVPEGTTIISARGTVGKIGMAPHDMTFNQSCYALRSRDPVGERFVYLATERLVERLKAMAHGSVFSTITRTTFASLNFAGATDGCFQAFEDVTKPLFAKIKANGEENQTLAALRDLLLPKLMSGEIRLKDTDTLT